MELTCYTLQCGISTMFISKKHPRYSAFGVLIMSGTICNMFNGEELMSLPSYSGAIANTARSANRMTSLRPDGKEDPVWPNGT